MFSIYDIFRRCTLNRVPKGPHMQPYLIFLTQGVVARRSSSKLKQFIDCEILLFYSRRDLVTLMINKAIEQLNLYSYLKVLQMYNTNFRLLQVQLVAIQQLNYFFLNNSLNKPQLNSCSCSKIRKKNLNVHNKPFQITLTTNWTVRHINRNQFLYFPRFLQTII